MDKTVKLKLKDKELNLCFNIVFSHRLAKLLDVNPLPEDLGVKIVDMLVDEPLNALKAVVSSGVYGYDFVNSDNIQQSLKPSEVALLLLECSNEQAKEVINVCLDALGLNLKADIEDLEDTETDKKKVAT